jgi:ubiquinone/menaquinone biosynthesis C-methylase UbiE
MQDAIVATDALEDTLTALVGPISTPAAAGNALVQRKRAEFARLAPQYELQCAVWSLGRVRALRREVAELALGEASGPVLELCCGTGGVTIELARRFERVIGVDLSPHMLKRARRRLERAGVQNVELREAEVSTLRFPERSFAAVVISLGMHELPRWIRDQVLAQAARWLRPGGRFVFCDVVEPRNRIIAALLRWIGRICIEDQHFDEYLEYPLEQRLEGHGFSLAEKRRHLLSCYETSAWLAPERQRQR